MKTTSTQYLEITDAKYISGYKIRITFNDGTVQVVDFGPFLAKARNPDGSPKIAKSPRPAIACATPVSAGMEIHTNTPAVKQMREGVLEFLLINHPLDCPICDQAGECKLQEYSVEYGQSNSRFVEPKVHKPKR